MAIHVYTCLRCDHEWASKQERERVRTCPRCKSPYWDRPRTRKRPQDASKVNDTVGKQLLLKKLDFILKVHDAMTVKRLLDSIEPPKTKEAVPEPEVEGEFREV